MNNNNKPFILLAGAIAALFAFSLVVRFVLLSQFGLPGGCMLLYLFIADRRYRPARRVVATRPAQRRESSFRRVQQCRPAAPTKSQRLQEIENLRASGAMSEDEYTAERARIISSI